jgi:hypothetical protein
VHAPPATSSEELLVETCYHEVSAYAESYEPHSATALANAQHTQNADSNCYHNKNIVKRVGYLVCLHWGWEAKAKSVRLNCILTGFHLLS